MPSVVGHINYAGLDAAGSATLTPVGVPVRIQGADRTQSPEGLAREGSVVLDHDLPQADYTRVEAVRSAWGRSIEDLLLTYTRAAWVVTWGWCARQSGAAGPRSGRLRPWPPARQVHTDFGLGFNPWTFLEPHVRAQLEKLGKSNGNSVTRWRCLNVWQPTSVGPHDTPLALCDARSVSQSDFVTSHGEYPSEFPLYRANQQHRWYYYPELCRHEVLVFSGLDPSYGTTRGVVPHTAFDDPTCPQGTAPRRSLELRALVAYED